MRSRSTTIVSVAVIAAGFCASIATQPPQAAKKSKQSPQQSQVAPVPMPLTGAPVIDVSGSPCCDHKCCKRSDRKCRHECAAAPCPPYIEYNGCPAPCSIEKVVTVTNPKTCCTVDVVVRVPANACERVRRDRDGDVELDYGKYEVEIKWKDHGRKLVVTYDD